MSSLGNPLICSCFLDYSLSPFTQNFLPGPFQPSIDKRQIDELATMRFLENGENVVSSGRPVWARPILPLLWGLWRHGTGSLPRVY